MINGLKYLFRSMFQGRFLHEIARVSKFSPAS